MTLLSPYYCTIMTLLWHHYNHYDRVSAPSLSECADSSLLSEHGEMIIILPRCVEFDFNQQFGAQLSWEAARVRCPVLLYTLFVPLYSLWQMSNQDCSCSKKVLHTADMQMAIWGVTSSWGSTKQAVVDARRVKTVQCCDYYLSLWHYYFTYYIQYRHYYKNLQFGLAFIEKTRSKASAITRD